MFKQSLMVGGAHSALAYADEKIHEEMTKDDQPIRHREFSPFQVFKARLMLMTGPRATPPTWRATRKAILRIEKGLPIKGGWRSWPSKGVS